MKLTASIALALCLATPLAAQTTFTDPANLRGERISPSDGHELPIDQGASGVAQLLRKLNTRASILNIVAHPDDEDGGMLTLYARGLGARVADLSLTRGEGGQNFVTGDFEDALGLIRTQELLSNDRYTGVTQLFGTEVDFGFSKTKEESFQKWTHERVLYDAVRAIRIVRPLVITATFIGNVTDGHGQHQVSGEIAQEAFKAAADPTVFPDQIAEGLLPWQALKVYARVPFADINSKGVYDYATNQYVPARFTNYVTGAVTTTKPPADVIVPEGDTDPLFTTAAACDNSGLSTESPKNPVLSTGPREREANRGGSGETCSFNLPPNTPLSYIQFARIGLSLQRTQISKNMTLPVSGSYNSGYTLYGSVLCNAPANARVPSLTSHDCHPEQAQRAEGPATKPASPQTSAPFSPQALSTQPNFFTGIDTSIEGIATLAPSAPPFLHYQLARLTKEIQSASDAFDPKNPTLVAPSLKDALQTTDALIGLMSSIDIDPLQKANALHELRIKRVQLNDALTLALGLHLDATAPSNDLVENSSPAIKTSLSESSTTPVTLTQLSIHGAEPNQIQSLASSPQQLTGTKLLDRDAQLPADHLTKITEPYFYRDNIEQPVYQLHNPALRNAPQTPAPLTAWATVTYQGAELTVGHIVHNGPQPISIIPPVSIASAPTATVLPTNQPTAQLTATLRTDATTSANINVQSPHNWSIEAKAAGPSSVDFFLHPTAPITGPQLFHVTAQTPNHHTYSEGFRPAGYPGLILTNYYTPATTRVVPVDLKLPQHVRIAYLPGTGDAVPEALASIGLAPTIITVADLAPAKLAAFDTVILGVRAYTANPNLHGAPTKALLDFARNGGNVLVQYETSGLTSADAPYPLNLGDAEKVVDETAPVQLLEPGESSSARTNGYPEPSANGSASLGTNRYPEASASGLIAQRRAGVLTPGYALLNIPNKITSADFNSWVAERGHGFLESWDPHYTALTETHDPGGSETAVQLPQRGGLITAQIGKGRWTYCAFALYRQLPEAVPGAFRLFVNLLTPAHN